jgi:phosphatidylinositol-3,4,5-trisphosphate 3-phosphatase and dual-specificity protein phosphatase PTEN
MQLIMGWLWIVPLFHLQQPLSRQGEKTTVLLKQSDVDFPLGYGTLLVDIELTLGWDLDTPDEELPREPERSASGNEKEPEAGGVLAAFGGDVQAVQAARD